MGEVDLVDLFTAARGDEESRWVFAQRIADMASGIARRSARARVCPEDLHQEIVIRTFRACSNPGLEFLTEGELVSYWMIRAKGFAVEASKAISPDREVQADLPDVPAADEPDERIADLQGYMIGHPDSGVSNAFWLDLQGIGAERVGQIVNAAPADVPWLRRRFVADAKAAMIERGEAVTARVLGLYACGYELGATLMQGRVMLESSRFDYESVADFDAIEHNFASMIRRSDFVVTNEIEGPPCEPTVWVRMLLERREVAWEEVRLGSIEPCLSGRTMALYAYLPWASRRAAFLALTKVAENELKAERY